MLVRCANDMAANVQLQAATCAKLHNWTAPLASAVRARHAATARAIAEENLHKSVSACYTGVTDNSRSRQLIC